MRRAHALVVNLTAHTTKAALTILTIGALLSAIWRIMLLKRRRADDTFPKKKRLRYSKKQRITDSFIRLLILTESRRYSQYVTVM